MNKQRGEPLACGRASEDTHGSGEVNSEKQRRQVCPDRRQSGADRRGPYYVRGLGYIFDFL